MRGVALPCVFVCLAIALRPSQAMFVGHMLTFGSAAMNYSTNASRIYSYFPQNGSDSNKVVGVDVSPYGTVKASVAALLFLQVFQSSKPKHDAYVLVH